MAEPIGPLSDDEIDKIFGMDKSSPDFTGKEEGREWDGSYEESECCNYHLLQWLAENIKDGGRMDEMTPDERKRASKHLSVLAEDLYQSDSTQKLEVSPEDHPLGAVAKMLHEILNPRDMVLLEEKTETLTIQMVGAGLKLKAGSATMRIRPSDAIVLAGTVGGWVSNNDEMAKEIQEIMAKAKAQFAKEQDGEGGE